MKTVYKTIYESVINEEAYLSREEEGELVSKAIMIAEEKNLSIEETCVCFNSLPAIRNYAEAMVDILGIEKYKEMEADNMRLIKERAWEDEFSKI